MLVFFSNYLPHENKQVRQDGVRKKERDREREREDKRRKKGADGGEGVRRKIGEIKNKILNITFF